MSADGPGKSEKFVATGRSTEEELRNIRTGMKRLFPIADDGSFDDLIKAIDRASKNS